MYHLVLNMKDERVHNREPPRHPNGRRVVYPGNLVGSIYASGNPEKMRALLDATPLGHGAYPISHYDGSVSILFPSASLLCYINAHPSQDSWSVHGFIDGGHAEVSTAARELAEMFRSVGIRIELAYLSDTCDDRAVPVPLT
jgi:hypothetical protein